MPADRAFARLRAHDPAGSLPDLDRESRERLRSRIVASPVGLPARRRFQRPAVALAAVVAMLAVTGVGWAVYRTLVGTSAEVESELAVWRQRLPLPPGATWQRPDLDRSALYGDRAGAMIAAGQATCAWFGYWLRADEQGDPARLRVADAGIARVRAALPVHAPGDPEEAGGYTPGALAAYDSIVADQRRREPAATRQYLRANCR
jgi:hypothetical protein